MTSGNGNQARRSPGNGPSSGMLSIGEIIALLDHLPAMIAYWDTEVRNVFANRAFLEWLGVSAEQACGRPASELLGRGSYGHVLDSVEAALRGESRSQDNAVVDRHGRLRHIHNVFVPAVNNGVITGLYTLSTDLTERVQHEQHHRAAAEQVAALAERERISEGLHASVLQQLYALVLALESPRAAEERTVDALRLVEDVIADVRAVAAAPPPTEAVDVAPWTADELLGILDHIPAVVAYWDRDLHIRFTNATLNAWLGWQRSEVFGLPGRVMLGDELFELNERYMRAALAGRTQTFVRTVRRADGSSMELQVTYLPHRVDDRIPGFYVLGVDITQLRRAESALRDTAERLAVLADRQRIAADLHDLVIQRLFATALTAQGLRAHVGPDGQAALDAVVEGVEEAITNLRAAILEMRDESAAVDPQGAVDRIVRQAEHALGFRPVLNIAGDLTGLPRPVLSDLLAVLTEALANVARHARATAVEVTVDADDELTVRVSDNGCGVADFSRHSGVRNMAARATALRGTFRMVPNRPAGTVIEWEAPLA